MIQTQTYLVDWEAIDAAIDDSAPLSIKVDRPTYSCRVPQHASSFALIFLTWPEVPKRSRLKFLMKVSLLRQQCARWWKNSTLCFEDPEDCFYFESDCAKLASLCEAFHALPIAKQREAIELWRTLLATIAINRGIKQPNRASIRGDNVCPTAKKLTRTRRS